MDIVLYYISLQEDLNEIANISCRDFSSLSERKSREWAQPLINQWGKIKVPRFHGSKEMCYHPRIWVVLFARTPRSGPESSTMSAAEHYELLRPGFYKYRNLLDFFSWPEEFSYEEGDWPVYKKNTIEAVTFPKWRNRTHSRRLKTVFDLAELICQELRSFKSNELNSLKQSDQDPRSRQKEMKDYIDGGCIVCGGRVFELIVSEHNHLFGSPVVGPGSRRQQHNVSKGFHCESCGLKHELVSRAGRQEKGKELSEGKKICPRCENKMIEVYLAVGGFPGHPHIHRGPLWGHECINCGYKEEISR